MRRHELRITLMVVTVAALGIAALLLFRDVHTNDTNCGSGLVARDTSAIRIESGNPAEDDFIEQVTAARCDRLVLRQRYLAALAVIGAITAGVAAKRIRPEPERFPGDPII
jgi:hypothetical protein